MCASGERRLASSPAEPLSRAIRGALRRSDTYASLYAKNLAIGSGATEGTCGLMQSRVKRRGQSWEPFGLHGILTIRSLVLSDRWNAAWAIFAAKQRANVRRAA